MYSVFLRPSTVISSSIISSGQSNDNQSLKQRCSSRQSLLSSEMNRVNMGGNANPNAYLGNGRDSDPKKKSVPPHVTGEWERKHTIIATEKLKCSTFLWVGFVNRAHLSSDLEISKKTREQRRKEIKKEFEKWENTNSIRHKSGCNWSFVFDPSGRLCYYWSLIVSIAFLYNFWTIIYRCAFQEIKESTVVTWFALDYFADFLYILDIAVNFRTGYLEEGVLQVSSLLIRWHFISYYSNPNWCFPPDG